MNISVMEIHGQARIALSGRFDFNSHRGFKRACEAPLGDTTVGEIVVDLGAVEYLDSSALGMLLNLREKTLALNKSVALANCRGVVADILGVANFGKLFAMR